MSMDKIESATPESNPQEPQQSPKPCCCCSHKKRNAILLLLLILVAGGAWMVIQLIGGSLRNTEPYQVAMQKIRTDPALRDALGQPITDSWRTAGQPEDMYFEVYGPKDNAKVHAKARCTQGKWDLVQLEVTLQPSGQRVLVPLEGEGDAPPFHDSQPTDAAKSPTNAPAPEYKFDVPAAPGGGPQKP
jgi:hypothetical protein